MGGALVLCYPPMRFPSIQARAGEAYLEAQCDDNFLIIISKALVFISLHWKSQNGKHGKEKQHLAPHRR